MLRFIAILLAMAVCGIASSQTDFVELQQLEKKGDWKTALELLKSQPSENPSHFYNLGTLYLRSGEPGLAVAWLEKANFREPHNPATQQNLLLARKELEKKLGAPLDSASNWIESVADRVPIDEIRGALGLLGCIVVLFWMRSYLKTRRIRQTLMQPAAILSILGFSITLGLYAMERYAAAHPPACLIKKEVIRSGPADRYLELAQLHEGAKVRIIGSGSGSDANAEGTPAAEAWMQIRFADSSVGWVRASSLLLL